MNERVYNAFKGRGRKARFWEITFVLQCEASFLGPVHLLSERVEAD